MKYLLIVIIALMFVGCDVNVSKMTQSTANEMVDKITYAKDSRTGLCFGMIASRKSGETSQSGMGMTEVPCARVEKFIR